MSDNIDIHTCPGPDRCVVCMRQEIERLRAALRNVADIPNGNTYFGQLQECAKIAKEALGDE